ncbi:MAG: outer membrane protein [Rhodothermales bacterium]
MSGSISIQGQFYPFAPIHDEQERQVVSVAAEVGYTREWASGARITVKPFFRYDSADEARTHFDLREAVWLLPRDDWELRLGVDKVFWGVTESVHLVDIVNQTDLIENPDGEDKLGQPMVYFTSARDWGTIDLFVLPYFRERTFPGPAGRLRRALVVDTDQTRFESRAERLHLDIAARYSHTIGALDFGLSYFGGTSRDPSFLAGVDETSTPVLVPLYQQIDQVSLDAQITRGAWLLKLEGLYRTGQDDRLGREDAYVASVAGFEYTFFGLGGSKMDLGVLAEHLFDDRSDRALTPFENDVFFGLRLAANDVAGTQVLAGLIQDLDTPARNFFLEASRRLTDSWTVDVEARFFTAARPDDLLFDLRRDDLIQLEFTYHFGRTVTDSGRGAPGAFLSSAEWFADLYLGAAITQRQDLTVITHTVLGVPSPVPVLEKFRNVDFDSSASFGGRFGLWLNSPSFLGLALDVFQYRPHIGSQTRTVTVLGSNFPFPLLDADIVVGAISFDLMFRGPSVTSSRASTGQLRPYFAVGPAIFIATVEDTTNFGPPSDQSDTDIGLGVKVGVGLSWRFRNNMALFGESRFTHVRPKVRFRDPGGETTVETDLNTHHLITGFSFRF